jgi:phosphonate transport system substrate-binding protein
MKKILPLCFFLVLFSCDRLYAARYTFSVLPRYFPEKLVSMHTPLTQYLSKELGSEVELILTEDFAHYEMQMLKGAISIGYQNPVVYANVSAQHEAIATAILGKDGDKFRGLVIARADSKIAGLDDLKGKTIMIVGKTSAGGYLSEKLSLLERKIDVTKDCQIVQAAGNHQENVIISVSVGDVDAGFIQEGAFAIADEFIAPNSIKKVSETAWIPNWAVSVDKNIPKEQKEKIRAALLKITPESEVAKALGISGFKSAGDADYDVIRKLME